MVPADSREPVAEPAPAPPDRPARTRPRWSDILLGVLVGIAGTVVGVTNLPAEEDQGRRMEHVEKVHWNVFADGEGAREVEPPVPPRQS